MGSALDDETMAFRNIFSELKQHKNFEAITKRIRCEFPKEGDRLVDAMSVASIGLQLKNFHVKRIQNGEGSGVMVEGEDNTWSIVIQNGRDWSILRQKRPKFQITGKIESIFHFLPIVKLSYCAAPT